MKLWEGTEFAQLADAVESHPLLLNAWRLGVCDQTVGDLLGVVPGDEAVPEVAREVAVRVMRALVTGENIATTITECAALIQQTKARAN
jgi:hypothetical protein